MTTSLSKIISNTYDSTEADGAPYKMRRLEGVSFSDSLIELLDGLDSADRFSAAYLYIESLSALNCVALFKAAENEPKLNRQLLVTYLVFKGFNISQNDDQILSRIFDIEWVQHSLSEFLAKGRYLDEIRQPQLGDDEIAENFESISTIVTPILGEVGTCFNTQFIPIVCLRWFSEIFNPKAIHRQGAIDLFVKQMAIGEVDSEDGIDEDVPSNYTAEFLVDIVFRLISYLTDPAKCGDEHFQALTQLNLNINAIELLVECGGLTHFFQQSMFDSLTRSVSTFSEYLIGLESASHSQQINGRYVFLIDSLTTGLARRRMTIMHQDGRPERFTLELFGACPQYVHIWAYQVIAWRLMAEMELNEWMLIPGAINSPRHLKELFWMPSGLTYGRFRIHNPNGPINDAAYGNLGTHFMGLLLSSSEDFVIENAVLEMLSLLIPSFRQNSVGSLSFETRLEECLPRDISPDDVKAILSQILLISKKSIEEIISSEGLEKVRVEIGGRLIDPTRIPEFPDRWLRTRFLPESDPLDAAINRLSQGRFRSEISELLTPLVALFRQRVIFPVLPVSKSQIQAVLSDRTAKSELVSQMADWVGTVRTLEAPRYFIAQLLDLLHHIIERDIVTGVSARNRDEFYRFFGPRFLKMVATLASAEVSLATAVPTLQQTLEECATGWLEAVNLINATGDLASGDLNRMVMAQVFFACQALVKDQAVRPILERGGMETLDGVDGAAAAGINDADDPHRVLALETLFYQFFGADVRRYFIKDDHCDYERVRAGDQDQDISMNVLPRILQFSELLRLVSDRHPALEWSKSNRQFLMHLLLNT